MTESLANFILNLIPGIGPIRLRRLIQQFGSATAVLHCSPSQLSACEGIGKETASAIANWQLTTDWQQELELCQKHNISYITADDQDYPTLLRQIPDAPICLYYRGNLSTKDSKAIAVVGSRITTAYGQNCAQKISYQLAYVGIPVVSGLARGIDTYAHRGALAACGRTVAIVGSGLLSLYPPENISLAEKIVAENGCIMSEFPLRRKPDRQSFAIRNRIIAGMTLGTVVVEAPLRSGALITANMAVEYGRLVFAVPGRIDTPHSAGCHQLIKNGAKLVTDVEDILNELSYLFHINSAHLADSASPQPATNNNIVVNPTDPQEHSFSLLSDDERKILAHITANPSSLDAIIERCQMPPHIVTSTLTRLELKRLIQNTPSGYCLRT